MKYLPLFLSLVLLGCAPTPKTTVVNSAGAVISKQSKPVKSFKKKCKPLKGVPCSSSMAVEERKMYAPEQANSFCLFEPNSEICK